MHNEKCIHGTVVRQCRCMDRNKVWSIVPCPDKCWYKSQPTPQPTLYDWAKEDG